jgi:serine/threonine protein kinase/CheY-like chemotaxis protein
MRLLVIDDDPRYRALLRHHVTCHWPEADLVSYNPVRRGPLPPEYLAQGYDAVLLDQDWQGGRGIEWLAGLVERPGFAPILFLADRDDDSQATRAREAGAVAVIARSKIDHERLLTALKLARDRQRKQLEAWSISSSGQLAERFGDAVIHGYRQIRRLASGSVSTLYLAESRALGTLVVLKVTPVTRKESGVDQAYERFVQEFDIVKRIRHPSIVRLHDLGVTEGHAYLVMEYFAGGDLRARMRHALAPRAALTFARDIALALDAIHSAGVLHRDLKPGNVMLRDDGSLALIDFGLAKHHAVALEITDTGLILGTPHYMSPEQGHGETVDGRSDLYSLGVILFEMLTRTKPFDAKNPMAIIYKHRKEAVPRLEPALAWLQPLIDRLLAKRPSDRFATAKESLGAIRVALESCRDEAIA